MGVFYFNSIRTENVHLESKFLEEPLVLATLVALLEGGLDVGLALAFAGGVLNFSI